MVQQRIQKNEKPNSLVTAGVICSNPRWGKLPTRESVNCWGGTNLGPYKLSYELFLAFLLVDRVEAMTRRFRKTVVRMEDRQREYEPLLFSPNSVGLQRLLDKNWGLFQETGMSHSVAG